MTSTRFVRGLNSRMLAYLAALLVFTATIFLYHNERALVDAGKTELVKCQQTQESLSAQLQVIFEYKVRLEKNLNEERNHHQETKDKLQAHLSDEQERNKENQEAINKFTALQQQFRLLQTQHGDLRGECDKAKTTCKAQLKLLEIKAASDMEKMKSRNMQVQDEADDYRKQLVDLQNNSRKTDTQADKYKKENIELKKENENLKEQIEKLEKRLKGIGSSTDRGGSVIGPNGARGDAHGGPDAGALAAPNQGRAHSPSSSTPTPDGRQGMNDVIANQLAASNSKALGKQSTTPQINPEALLSQEKAAHGGVVAPPVAPAPPSLGSSQGPKQAVQPVKPKESLQEAQQQQGVLPMPFAFQENQGQGQLSGVPHVPAVLPALAPPQQNVLPPQSHEAPSNQGQEPPLDDPQESIGKFIDRLDHDDWIRLYRRPVDFPGQSPENGRAHPRMRLQGPEWNRHQVPFQGVDYDKEVHAQENEEDDDDDADQMDNAVNQFHQEGKGEENKVGEEKKIGENKFFGRKNIMVNPR